MVRHRPPRQSHNNKKEGEEHTNDGEHARADLPNLIAEVQEPDGQPTEDDGEMEPGEERPLIRERHLRLDAHGERNALVRRALEERLRRHRG